MKELIHIDDQRACLHCDNGECGYIMPEGSLTWGRHLIGYPCPKCSSNMLTVEDYETSDRVQRALQWINAWSGWINAWFGWMGKEYSPSDPEWKNAVSMRRHAGKVIVKEEPRE